MSIQIFVSGLMAVSLLTSLATQGLKAIFKELKVKIYPTTLASIVSVVLGVALGVCYGLLNEVTFDVQYIVCIVALTFLSFLCATNGYDQVKKAIKQIFG